MGFEAGEGEEEIRNQGWSRVKSFSQETRFKSQLSPRIGGKGATGSHFDYQKSQVQDAHDSLTQLPFFLFHRTHCEIKKGKQS